MRHLPPINLLVDPKYPLLRLYTVIEQYRKDPSSKNQKILTLSSLRPPKQDDDETCAAHFVAEGCSGSERFLRGLTKELYLLR